MTINWDLDVDHIEEVDEDFEQFFMNFNKRQDFDDYHRNRLENCHFRRIRITENILNGRCKVKVAKCNEADCPDCGPWLRQNVKKAFESHLDNGPMRKLEGLTKSEQQKLMRKYGKNGASFTAVEDENHNVTFQAFVKTSDNIGREFTKEDLEQEDLNNWIKPVFGHNKSGNLHKVEKSPAASPPKKQQTNEDEESHSVMAEEWVIDTSECNKVTGKNLSNEQWAEAIDELAVYNTQELLPKTIDELKKALRKRRDARRNAINLVGAKLHTVEARYTRVKESEIDWSISPFKYMSIIQYVKNDIVGKSDGKKIQT